MELCDFENIYFINDPLSDRAFRADYSDKIDDIGIFTGNTKPSTSVITKHYAGSKTPGDIIWTGGLLIIFHEKVINILLKHNFKGWNTYDVTVLNNKDEEIPNYCGFAITGRCGLFSHENSEIIYKNFPGGTYPFLKGRYFNKDSWDGSDFFLEKQDNNGNGSMILSTTNEVVDIFKKEKIKNIKFQNILEFEIVASDVPQEKLPKALRNS